MSDENFTIDHVTGHINYNSGNIFIGDCVFIRSDVWNGREWFRVFKRPSGEVVYYRYSGYALSDAISDCVWYMIKKGLVK